jgi:FAD-linked oxidoreductase
LNRKDYRAMQWQNWCGLARCSPAAYETPGSIEDVQRIVREAARAGRRIRVAGSGHSFTNLVPSDDVLISLDNLQGLAAVDREKREAEVFGGTKLWRLNELLDEQGLAMENLGDINKQSIAGAISTGTHGTGIRYGNISSQVCALTLVTAAGELLECSEEKSREIFKAAQVSLGALGVIVKARLRLEPAYNLHYVRKRASLEETARKLNEYRDATRHFEFYWFPFTDTVQLKFLNKTDEPARERPVRKFLSDIILENASFGLMSWACRARPSLCRGVSRLAAKFVSEGEEVSRAHKVFSTARLVRFYEMEYGLPAERGIETLRELRDWLERSDINVHFPVEFRFVKGDDIYLSPSYGRDTAYIAVHMYRGMEYQRYFAGAEAIFKRHDGRPHWGKLHTRTAEELASLYPRWNDFQKTRDDLDPSGTFMNGHLRTLFFTRQQSAV